MTIPARFIPMGQMLERIAFIHDVPSGVELVCPGATPFDVWRLILRYPDADDRTWYGATPYDCVLLCYVATIEGEL
jgi:hypothetical protein